MTSLSDKTEPNRERPLAEYYEQVIQALIEHAQHNHTRSLHDYLTALEQFRIALLLELADHHNSVITSRLIEKRLLSLYPLLTGQYDLTAEVYAVYAVLDVQFNTLISAAFDSLSASLPANLAVDEVNSALTATQQQQLHQFTNAQVLKSASMFLLPQPKRPISCGYRVSEAQAGRFAQFVSEDVRIDDSCVLTLALKTELQQDLLTVIEHNRQQLQSSRFSWTRRNYQRRLHHLDHAQVMLRSPAVLTVSEFNRQASGLVSSCNQHSSVFSVILSMLSRRLTKTATDIQALRQKVARRSSSSYRSRYESAKRIVGEDISS